MKLSLEIDSAALAFIVAAAAAAHPDEACGLLFGTPGRIETATQARNVAADPARAFEIDPQALFDAQRAARSGGPAVVGSWHSHPNGRATPSARDAAGAEPGALWLIVAAGAVRAFEMTATGFFEREMWVEAGDVSLACPHPVKSGSPPSRG
jgi:desampylase